MLKVVRREAPARHAYKDVWTFFLNTVNRDYYKGSILKICRLSISKSKLINFVKCKCNDAGGNCRWTGDHIKCIDKNIKTTGPNQNCIILYITEVWNEAKACEPFR